MVPPVPEYAAILAAPIFAPDRRPGPSEAEPSESGGGGSLSGYAAIGAVAGRDVATAVVTEPGGGIKTLGRGDELNGWRLVGVDRTHVYFERNGARHTLVVGAQPEAAPTPGGTAAADAADATTPANNR
jgi:general secretion pathway protein N